MSRQQLELRTYVVLMAVFSAIAGLIVSRADVATQASYWSQLGSEMDAAPSVWRTFGVLATTGLPVVGLVGALLGCILFLLTFRAPRAASRVSVIYAAGVCLLAAAGLSRMSILAQSTGHSSTNYQLLGYPAIIISGFYLALVTWHLLPKTRQSTPSD